MQRSGWIHLNLDIPVVIEETPSKITPCSLLKMKHALGGCALAMLAQQAAGAMTLTLNGAPAVPGAYNIASDTTLVFDNGLSRFSFAMHPNSWQVVEVIVNGTQISGTFGESSWYVDWSGGKNGDVAVWDTLSILNVSDAVLHVAFVDTNPRRQLRHELHNVMTPDTRGMYGYDVMTAQERAGLSEIRFNTRWNRECKNF